jgi:enoyl-CoA hydratase/carnithine racemase
LKRPFGTKNFSEEGFLLYKTVEIKKSAGIATLTLNLPDCRNAMTHEMADEFPKAVAELALDQELQVVVLTGSGKAFCAGGDLDALKTQTGWTPEQNRVFMGHFYRAFLSVIKLPVPTIAAINGPAIGAGLCLALGCDIRYARQGAKLGATYMNIGLFPGMGATHLLPYHIGHARTAELLLTGRLLEAEEAAQQGLINRVLPAEQLLPYAYEVAGSIAAKSPSAVRAMKQVLQRQMLDGLDRALDVEALAQTISFGSAEMKAVLAGLRQK